MELFEERRASPWTRSAIIFSIIFSVILLVWTIIAIAWVMCVFLAALIVTDCSC